MAISLTCTCGAQLEIDDKFAGQAIPCPDCQRPLNTSAPAEEPRDLQVSGLALTSLILALVGAFILPVSVAAIAVGYLAMRQIARAPDRLGGLNYARAGMIVGGVCTLLTMSALISNEILGLDSLLREYRYASQLDYATDSAGFYTAALGKDDRLGMQRPSRSWGRLTARGQSTDMLTLLNLREDAQLIALPFNGPEDEQGARDKAADRLRQSDLFGKVLSKSGEVKPASPEAAEAKPVPDSKTGDMTLEVRFGGYDRVFLLRVVKVNADYYLLAGGARKGRFARLSDEFARAFDSFKQVEN
jgi:hypothetical protein